MSDMSSPQRCLIAKLAPRGQLPRRLRVAALLMPLNVHARASLPHDGVPDVLLQQGGHRPAVLLVEQRECLATGGFEHFARPSMHNDVAVSSEQSKPKKSMSQVCQVC